MKAAVFEGEGLLKIETVEKPRIINSNDVLLRVEYCAICGSDVSVVSVPRRHPATYHTIIGHEYVGIVEKIGSDVSSLSVGDRVVVEPNISCGKCEACRSGHSNMCPNMRLTGFHYNGGMAEYSVMPDKQLYKLRKKEIDEKVAALAEPLACIVNSLNKVKVRAGDYCLVLGDGPIGLMYTELLLACGVSKVIVSAHSAVRKRVAQALGAVVIDSRQDNLVEFVKRHTNNLGADLVIDCVGTLVDDAISCCAVGGQVILFGLDNTAKEEISAYDVSHRELQILGSYVTKDSFSRAVRLIEEGVVKFNEIITHVFDLSEIHKGFEAIQNKEAIKVVIKCNRSER